MAETDQQLTESEGELSKKERRELRRQTEDEKRIGFVRSLKRKRILKWVIFVVVIVVVSWGVYRWARTSEANLPGEAIPEQPALHINPGEPIPGIYHSNPPVSGWHYPQPADWGIYDKELPDQVLIHNLEHGGVWISYRPDVPQEVIDNLKKVAGGYKRKVILTPRAANNSPIALAAWGRLDKFDYFDEARVRKFIKAFKDKGPEFVP